MLPKQPTQRFLPCLSSSFSGTDDARLAADTRAGMYYVANTLRGIDGRRRGSDMDAFLLGVKASVSGIRPALFLVEAQAGTASDALPD